MLYPALKNWIVRAGALCAALAALHGCGGGVDSGGTGSFASGPITGFGSVIVNGVRFDDSLAQVIDGDGIGRTRDDLRLGMWVEIEAGALAAGGSSASAMRIRFASELAGPVTAIDAAGGSFQLLGQRVSVDATTVFDDSLTDGLEGLQPGDVVAVYGAFDPAAARYRATRVEPAPTLVAPHLRGPLAAVNSGTQTLRIGDTTYGYAGASGVPDNLSAGQFVRLRLGLEAAPLRWVVRAFSPGLRDLSEGDEVRYKGLVGAWTSPLAFSVGGRPVDASAASFPDGRDGVVPGARVEVEGTVQGGVLRAREVSIQSDDDERQRGFEITARIDAVNPVQQTLVLRGVTVSTARPDLRYDNGSAADLSVGRRVEVRGQLSLSRQRIEATRISFE